MTRVFLLLLRGFLSSHVCHELLVFWRLHILCHHSLQTLIGGRCSSFLGVFLFFQVSRFSRAPAWVCLLLEAFSPKENQPGVPTSCTLHYPRPLPQWPLLLFRWTERVHFNPHNRAFFSRSDSSGKQLSRPDSAAHVSALSMVLRTDSALLCAIKYTGFNRNPWHPTRRYYTESILKGKRHCYHLGKALIIIIIINYYYLLPELVFFPKFWAL